jgi:PAN domain
MYRTYSIIIPYSSAVGVGENRCAAWSYVQPGVQGPRARCWLKTLVPHPVDNPNVISGVKFRRPASTL